MKRYAFLIGVALAVSPLSRGENLPGINPPAENHGATPAFNSTGDEFQNEPEDTWSPEVIKIYDESEVDSLLNEGVRILRRRGDILLCFVPVPADPASTDNDNNDTRTRARKRVDDRRRHRDVRRPVPTMDKALKWYGADRILTGNSLPQPYTGKGVVAGFCDIGFDPLHPTFLDEEGNSRVSRIFQYKEREGERIVISGDKEYEEWQTDTNEEYHATHVAGILAGSGNRSASDMQYAGVARDAEIVASVCQLSDVGLLGGVENIIEYAKSVGKPAVINLSMGNYIGAHDGSSLFSQYLDLCAEDAIIVLSAGNEGNSTCSISHTFSSDDDTLGFRLGNTTWNQMEMYGMTDVWSLDDTPIPVSIGVYDDESRKLVAEWPMTIADASDPVYIFGSDFGEDADPGFAPYFTGWLAFGGGVDPENGRYNLQVVYDYDAHEKVSGGWARYTVAVRLGGAESQQIDVFADATYTRLMTLSGYPSPSPAFSFSDLACGHNVLSVGMYGNRDYVPSWQPGDKPIRQPGDIPSDAADGEGTSTGYTAGEIAVHSSYATLRDGRVMPLTVAPGAPVMSAVSRHYLANIYPDEVYVSPWASQSGTSMAAPYVAGFVATMLEAFPELTVADVQKALAATNHTDVPDPGNPRHGAGWFDPYAALRYLMDNASAEGVAADPDAVRITVRHGRVEIFNPTGAPVDVEVYSAAGTLYSRSQAQAGVTSFELPGGLWMVRCGRVCDKILL